MSAPNNPIDDFLDEESDRLHRRLPDGPISEIYQAYTATDSDRLLGFLLQMGYEEVSIVTCDAWKRQVGGVPRNCFVIVKLTEQVIGTQHGLARPFLILARVRETSLTPVANDIQKTIYQIHKIQAKVDPLTNVELQWGALRADILGTYFDESAPDGTMKIGFGNDLDHFLSAHWYEVYVPTDEHLERLINSFVDDAHPISIGRLRYTETETLGRGRQVEVRISPQDFISNRTALFGKTRMGKSNTIKVILDMMVRTLAHVGQLIIDMSGEYTYPDPQTGASIYLAYPDQCVRYSLKPRRPEREAQAAVPPPTMLRANFYKQIELGHAIIQSLYDTYHPRRPDYMAAFFGWEPADAADITSRFSEMSNQVRYKRALGMYQALLYEAGFAVDPNAHQVQLCLHEALRERLAQTMSLQQVGRMETKADGGQRLADTQPLGMAARIYEQLWVLYESQPGNQTLFPISRNSGKPYLEAIHISLLRMIADRSISGAKKLTPFKAYHSPEGLDVIKAIAADVQRGRTVLIDFASADPVVAKYYSELIVRALLATQMERFSSLEQEEFETHSVLIYFEEAHNLFRQDDKDLTSIYNKLAKEGGKYRIGMVYATQSMTTLSADLLKNTENFVVAHLNDDREVTELERRYEFRGTGLDVQRARSKGYVRMITLSHRYALPVQVRLFALE